MEIIVKDKSIIWIHNKNLDISINILKDENKIIVAVFLDPKRAFETVSRTILLEKLKNIGLFGTIHINSFIHI